MNGAVIQIRPYEEADLEGLLPLMSELGYPVSADEMRGRLARMGADHLTLVADAGGEIAGFIGLTTVHLYEQSSPIGYILAFSVAASRHRQGIGRALLAAAEDHLQRQGIHDIRVNSGLHREDAHRFYEAMGYRKTGYRLRKAAGDI